MKKYAILSMDIEDWYHLDYFSKSKTDRTVSMLDGFSNYLDILDSHNIKTTFFVLSELCAENAVLIKQADSNGHEIACHGMHHTRPVMINEDDFRSQITEARETISSLIGKDVIGYRAPCYSIDDRRYDIVRQCGFRYSSSNMAVTGHPLYGDLDLSSFSQPMKSVYVKDGFCEFALSTQNFAGKDIAVSGGGWIRIFPWKALMKPLIKKYIAASEVYTLYIHPFELSDRKMPYVKDASPLMNFRSKKGLGGIKKKLNELISMLQNEGYEFTTFGQLAEEIIKENVTV